MALNGCGFVCKWILIIYNVLITGLGVVLLGLGLWLRFGDDTREIFNREELSSTAFVTAVNTVIALGSITLTVALFGHYGSCKESRGALKMFSALLILLAVAEIAVGVLALSNNDQVVKKLSEAYDEVYFLYVKKEDSALALTLTFIHRLLYCCGLTGVPIIEVVQKTCPNPGASEQLIMPRCPAAITQAFDSMVAPLIVFFLVSGALLITALICSGVLISQVGRATAQYVILTNSAPVVVAPHPYFQPVSIPHPHQDPVVFTPAPVANVPVPQAHQFP